MLLYSSNEVVGKYTADMFHMPSEIALYRAKESGRNRVVLYKQG